MRCKTIFTEDELWPPFKTGSRRLVPQNIIGVIHCIVTGARARLDARMANRFVESYCIPNPPSVNANSQLLGCALALTLCVEPPNQPKHPSSSKTSIFSQVSRVTPSFSSRETDTDIVVFAIRPTPEIQRVQKLFIIRNYYCSLTPRWSASQGSEL